jgi:hypothetical protein
VPVGVAVRLGLKRIEPIPATADAFNRENVAVLYLVVFKEPTHPLAPTKEVSRFTRSGVAPDVGLDGFPHAFEIDLDRATGAVRIPSGSPDTICGKEVEMSVDVDVTLAKIARRYG